MLYSGQLPGSLVELGHNLTGNYVKAVDVIIDGKPGTRVKTIKLEGDFHISETTRRCQTTRIPLVIMDAFLLNEQKPMAGRAWL